MFYLLKLMLRRKLWFFIAFLSMLVSAIFTVVQAIAIARIFSATADIPSIDKSGNPYMDETSSLFPGFAPTFGEQIERMISIYFHSGSQEAIRYLVNSGSVPLLLFVVLGIFLSITLVFQIFSYFKDVSNEYLSVLAVGKLREKVVSHLIDLPYSFYKKNSPASIVGKLFDDLTNSRVLMVKILEGGFYGPIIGVIALLSLLSINYRFVFVAFFILLAVGLIINTMSSLIKKGLRLVQAQMEFLFQKIQSMIYGIETIKIFARSEDEKNSFERHNEEYQNLSKKHIFISMLSRPILEFCTYVAISFMLIYISLLVWRQEMSFNDMISIFMLGIFTLPYVQRFGVVFVLKQQVDVHVERVLKLIEEPSEKTSALSKKMEDFDGGARFENVSFSYDELEVLHSVSFEAKNGEMIAFVGLSGSGKTTIAHLLCSFLEPSQGNIFFGRQKLSDFSFEERRSQVSFVSQDNILFPMSIYDNIAYAKPGASREEVLDAAQKSYCHEFVESFEKGYDTILTDMGKSLSGGQRQRICLARAILKPSKILVLDEATSALDSRSEQAVQKSIELVRGEKTLFVIAHRIATVKEADRIIVMDKGRIVEVGSHRELIEKKGIYKSFTDIQGL